ncbi:MAG: hypothetical protein IPH89_15115 [Bacteroidetes bacterium]|nr:hypothetical protein [Bacteroidota bacterium]
MLKFGKPFIAAFDGQSGNQIFYSGMGDDPILNFQLDDEFILLIFKSGIKKYKLETGRNVFRREIEENEYGELKYFVGSQVFVSTANEALINLLKIDSGKVYVYTNQGKILSVDKQLNISHVFGRESIKVSYLQNEDWKFISKGEQTYVFDDSDTLIVETEMSSSTFIHNNILYFTRNNILSSIDMNQLLVKKED